jgi:hypothetical protein
MRWPVGKIAESGSHSGIHARFRSLQIAVRLAPPIFVDDIGERNTADEAEPTIG